MSYPFIYPGNDLTQIPVVPGGECGEVQWVSAAQIQELVANIKPGQYIGFVWVAAFAPDVQADPEFKNFLWVDISVPWPYALRLFNLGTLTWDLWTPPAGSISGDAFIDGSISPTKLATGGIGNAKKILQVDIQGKTFIYVFAKDAIDDGTLPVSKLLVPPGTPTGAFLQVVGPNSLAFVLLTTNYIISLITDGSIPISKLSPGDGKDGQSIWLKPDPITGKLRFEFFFPSAGGLPTVAAGQAGYVLTVTKTSVDPAPITYGWTAQPLPPSAVIKKFRAAKVPIHNIPAQANIPFQRGSLGGGSQSQSTTPHGFGTMPTIRVVAKCIATGDKTGYIVGDEVPMESIIYGDATPIWVAYTTATQVIITRVDGHTTEPAPDAPKVAFPGPDGDGHPWSYQPSPNYYPLQTINNYWEFWIYATNPTLIVTP